MHIIQARNVEEAYILGMQHLVSHGTRESSRAGEVLVAPTPVTTVYLLPQERVLYDARRDANPFFHLMESVWMLAGEQNARLLDRYVKDFSSRFAEDDGLAHGAYGYRWRRHFTRYTDGGSHQIDQLIEASTILRDNPGSRQAVIAMWDPAVDLGAVKRDIPCNDLIMLRGRRDHLDQAWCLDMTVLCRSNDAVWGAYGANAVHMSIMMEVLAGLACMKVGRYYQVSNNFHVYTDILQRVWPSYGAGLHSMYRHGHVQYHPILRKGEDALLLLLDCEEFVRDVAEDGDMIRPGATTRYRTHWMNSVVHPMHQVHNVWRQGRRDQAIEMTNLIHGATDWQFAARAWMGRRMSESTSVSGSLDIRSL